VLKRLALPAAVAVLSPLLVACGGASSSTTAEDTPPSSSTASSSSASSVSCDYSASPQGATRTVEPPPATPDVQGKVAVTMTTSIGSLRATLDADKTTCHRLTVAPSTIFVLQCGDPSGTGTGGPGYTVPDELSGKETYGAGTLAMANTGQPDSGGSQFFVVYRDTPLPPSYTVFGQVDAAGVKAVQHMAAKGTDNAFGDGDGHPKVPVTITGVTIG
jgi:peptidyl-prolyl cis-trans isomerase B (cyclophilin B)